MTPAGEDLRQTRRAALFLASACFAAGGLAGCFLALRYPLDAGGTAWLLGGQDPNALRPELWRELAAVLRWPLLACTAVPLPAGGALVAGLFLLRGLLLSYGISAVTLAPVPSAPLAAFLLYGPASLLAVPAFFLLGVECLVRKAGGGRPGGPLRLALLTAPVLAVCAVLDWKLLPDLLVRCFG